MSNELSRILTRAPRREAQVLWRAQTAAIFGAAALLSSCGTITLMENADEAALSEAQTELRTASDELKRTPWPEPDEASMMGDMLSILISGRKEANSEADDVTTPQEAARLYLADKINNAITGPESADAAMRTVAFDAADMLQTASRVEQSALKIAAEKQSTTYLNDDLQAIEGAIAQLRAHREMFDRILKVIELDSGTSTRIERRRMAAEFAAAAEQLGASADALLAANATREEKRFWSFIDGPDLNFTGR